VHRYAAVAPGLFNAVVNRCVDASKMCMSDMMAIDAQGGMGRSSTVSEREQPGALAKRRIVDAQNCTPEELAAQAAKAANAGKSGTAAQL